MLEKIPASVGHALAGIRPGLDKTVYYDEQLRAVPETISVTSTAFEHGAPMPARFTEDGEKISPPLAWSGIPESANAVALLIEDADSPTPKPLVHAIAWDLPGHDLSLPEGALKSAGSPGRRVALGRNSILSAEYLPPDPPTGHGAHHYFIQVFALDAPPALEGKPGRGKMVEAIAGHVLAKGFLIGTYERP
jgi:Raf kinase inhibitor-like YbhB/YbcL family protein